MGDGVRFIQSDTGSQQYVSVRGAALGLSYSDAVAYDNAGNAYTNLVMPAGYVTSPIHAPVIPANTVLRAAGSQAQYFWDGSLLRAIADTATSQCFLLAFPQNGAAMVPPSWVAARTSGIQAQCSLADGRRFTESSYSGTSQYISVRGAALPVAYSDAIWYDANGNNNAVDIALGYIENPIHAAILPANTLLRPTGSDAQVPMGWQPTTLRSRCGYLYLSAQQVPAKRSGGCASQLGGNAASWRQSIV